MDEILEVFGINWKLLLIQSVNFGILLLVLWRFLYRPLVKIMGERQSVIAKGVQNARDAEERLKSIEEEKDSHRINNDNRHRQITRELPHQNDFNFFLLYCHAIVG